LQNNTVLTSILEAAYVLKGSQHCTESRKVRVN